MNHPQQPCSSCYQRTLLKQPVTQISLPFIIGGSAGITATLLTQPIDTIKVYLQLSGEGKKTTAAGTSSPTTIVSATRRLISDAGFLSLYQGTSAAIMRQIVYGTARLGLFFSIEKYLKAQAEQQQQRGSRGETYSFKSRIFAGVTAGVLGSFIGTPTEVALIRMQSDLAKPAAEKQNYKSVFDVWAKIIRHEGVLSMWNGVKPTVIRAACTNFGQLTMYSEAKQQLASPVFRVSNEMTRVVLSAMIAGGIAGLISCPFDLVKTRLQKQALAPNGVRQYKGTIDCFVKVAWNEGFLRFYRGATAFYLRATAHTYACFLPTSGSSYLILTIYTE